MRRLVPLGTFVIALPFSAATSQTPSDRRSVDVLDYDITLDVPDSGRFIRGDATLTIARHASANTLTLDLLDPTVLEVAVNGATVRSTRGRETLDVPLPPWRGNSDTVRVRVVYEGVVTDGLVATRDEMGRWTYFGDNWPNRGRHWIPSIDHPSDKATVTWTVRAPSNRTVVANGLRVEQRPIVSGKDAPLRTLTRWRESRPIPVYVMVIAVAPMIERSLGETACGLAEHARCVVQSVYVDPELADYPPGNFAEAPRIVEYFGRLIGPFPYEKLAHLQSATRFGGMENASAIFYSDQAFEARNVPVGLIAHEIAHQWFGDAVTPREWPHLWLSEGFATYFDALWTERSRGDSAFRAQLRDLRGNVVGAEVVATRPVIDTTERSLMSLLNANSYQKGGLVLHMLRREVGDSVFYGALRAFYMAHRHGNALSSDLQSAVERAAGRPLDWFFDQWLRRPGFPELTIRWTHDSASRRVVLDVEQSERFGLWRVPLNVALETSEGLRTVRVDVPPSRVTRITVPIELSARPARVVFDPGDDLLATIALRPE
jgi:aminopeptidase N